MTLFGRAGAIQQDRQDLAPSTGPQTRSTGSTAWDQGNLATGRCGCDPGPDVTAALSGWLCRCVARTGAHRGH